MCRRSCAGPLHPKSAPCRFLGGVDALSVPVILTHSRPTSEPQRSIGIVSVSTASTAYLKRLMDHITYVNLT